MSLMSHAMRQVALGVIGDGIQKTPQPDIPLAVRLPHMSHTLRTQEEILAILRRESGRCERSGLEFCMAVFAPGTGQGAVERLSQLLVENARATDEVGFYNQRDLCAVLAYTGPAGGEKYVSRIILKAAAENLIAVSKLHVYRAAKIGSDATLDEFKAPRSVPAGVSPDGRVVRRRRRDMDSA